MSFVSARLPSHHSQSWKHPDSVVDEDEEDGTVYSQSEHESVSTAKTAPAASTWFRAGAMRMSDWVRLLLVLGICIMALYLGSMMWNHHPLTEHPTVRDGQRYVQHVLKEVHDSEWGYEHRPL